jgi:hypothetical protein
MILSIRGHLGILESLNYLNVIKKKLYSFPESEVYVTWSLSAITIDIKIKQAKRIKILEWLAILNNQNDSSVMIIQMTHRQFLVENI